MCNGLVPEYNAQNLLPEMFLLYSPRDRVNKDREAGLEWEAAPKWCGTLLRLGGENALLEEA